MAERRSEQSVGRKLALATVAVGGSLLLLEGIARLVVPPRDATTHREHEEMIRVLGLPSLNDTMEFDPDLFWRLKPRLDRFHVAGRIGQKAIDFTVSTEDSLRRPSVSIAPGRRRVLALGDSCTFGLGVDDTETWPAVLGGVLGGEGVDVINAGVPGYSAYQGLRFLETRGAALDPHVVVAGFGFNDKDDGMSRSDLETARALAVQRWEHWLIRSHLYDGMRRSLGGFAAKPPSAPKGKPRLSEQEFDETLRAIKRWCDDRDARLYVLVWPWEEQVRRRLPGFYYYQQTASTFCQRERVPMIDLPAAFTSAGGSLFLDHVHANADGCRVAAEAVRGAVRATLVSSDGRRSP